MKIYVLIYHWSTYTQLHCHYCASLTDPAHISFLYIAEISRTPLNANEQRRNGTVHLITPCRTIEFVYGNVNYTACHEMAPLIDGRPAGRAAGWQAVQPAWGLSVTTHTHLNLHVIYKLTNWQAPARLWWGQRQTFTADRLFRITTTYHNFWRFWVIDAIIYRNRKSSW